MRVDGSDDCLADACTPGDPICALIQGLRWSRIEGCLTPTQREQAIESLCAGGPCDPIDIQLNGVSVAAPECGDTIDIPVLNTLGTPVGSWDGTRWLAPSGQALHCSIWWRIASKVYAAYINLSQVNSYT